MRKRFGQHFLTDLNIIEKIIQAIHLKPEQTVLEIGPGAGALTEALLTKLPALYAVEIDRDLAKTLEERFSPERLRLFVQDALTFDVDSIISPQPIRLVGNLPYNISTPFIFHCLKFTSRIQDMHFMLQKEVVDRLAAPPGSKTYGRLSVMAQYYCQINALFTVEAGSFTPPPQVRSAIVRLTPRAFDPVCLDLELFAHIVLSAFSHRRKTIHNSLKEIATDEQLRQAHILPQERPENISAKQFVHLTNIIHGSHRSINEIDSKKPLGSCPVTYLL